MRRKNWMRVTFFCSILVLLILMVYGGLLVMETAVFSSKDEQTITTKMIVRDGVKYYPRKNMTVVMLLGVDKEGKVVASTEPNHGYPVDMVTLLVFDEREENVKLLCINRDTMVEMPRLDEKGRVTGTRVAQLALSHSYGYGLEDSCVNTRTAVSNLLYDLYVDYYLAMNMDAVAILNDLVGGVTVNVTHDFSLVDPTIQLGEMKLKGNQALSYVQARQGVGDQLALSRVSRQKDYMEGFITAMKEKAEQNDTFILSAYEEVSDYVVTDMSISVISRLVEDYGAYQLEEAYILEGENVLVEDYYEYHVDEKALDELVLSLFYEPIK